MKRSLRLFDVVCLGLNAVVGSGIFLLPDDLYREMGVLSPLAFLLCGLGLVPVALCYAVAARHHDRTGGPYLYAREAFGTVPAFVVGFMAYATGVLSFAAVAAAAASSLGALLPGLATSFGAWVAAVAAVLFFSGLNYLGARPGALTVDTFTVAKFAILAILVVALAPRVGSSIPSAGLPRGPSGVGAAVFMAVFAAQGFEVVGVPAGESRNPERNVPLATLGSLLLATVLYMLLQSVLVGAYPGLAAPSDTPLADAVLSVDARLGVVAAVGGLISTWGFVAGTALGTPRYLFALSGGGHFPKAFATVHPRFGSPAHAILLTAGLTVAFVTSFDYRSLIGMSNVTIAVQYLTTCLAVAKLQRGPKAEGYRLWGGATAPVLGAAMSLWIFSEASFEELAWVAASLALGAAALWTTRRLARQPGSPT